MTMHLKHQIGDRVRVAAPDRKRHTWAVARSTALQDTVGTIVRDRDSRGNEKPARTSWARQTPSLAG